MSAIDKLKAELTRLGVEYDFTDRLREVPSYQSVTWWFNTADKAKFMEFHDGSTLLIVRSVKSGITHEEAIAATLGPMTCQADETDTWECVCDGIGHYGKRVTVHVMECSECGHTYEHVNGSYEYCPHCGRRIVKEDK